MSTIETPFGLTPRELEVMELLVTGYSVKDIATAQGVSYFTVDTQIRAIYRKMGIQSRAQAVYRWLYRDGERCPHCHQPIQRAQATEKKI